MVTYAGSRAFNVVIFPLELLYQKKVTALLEYFNEIPYGCMHVIRSMPVVMINCESRPYVVATYLYL